MLRQLVVMMGCGPTREVDRVLDLAIMGHGTLRDVGTALIPVTVSTHVGKDLIPVTVGILFASRSRTTRVRPLLLCMTRLRKKYLATLQRSST